MCFKPNVYLQSDHHQPQCHAKSSLYLILQCMSTVKQSQMLFFFFLLSLVTVRPPEHFNYVQNLLTHKDTC